jgi:hypothetical protein
LAQQVAKAADAPEIAEAVVTTWQQIVSALVPIFGQQGVAALYKRSLKLASKHYPWLADSQGVVEMTIDFATMRSMLARQARTDAAAAGEIVVHTFYGLVVSLVGPSLTERLLRWVWEDPVTRASAQELQ